VITIWTTRFPIHIPYFQLTKCVCVCVCLCFWVAQQRQFVPCTQLPSWLFVTEVVSACNAVRCESLRTSIIQGKSVFRGSCMVWYTGRNAAEWGLESRPTWKFIVLTIASLVALGSSQPLSIGFFFWPVKRWGRYVTNVSTECNARSLQFYCGNGGGEGVLDTGDRIRYSD